MQKFTFAIAVLLVVVASASAGEVEIIVPVLEGGATLALLGLGIASVIALKRKLTRNEE